MVGDAMTNSYTVHWDQNGRVELRCGNSGRSILYAMLTAPLLSGQFWMLSSTDVRPVGRLVRRIANPGNGVVYVLYDQEDKALALIHYPMPTLSQTESTLPFRRAQLVLPRQNVKLDSFEEEAATSIRTSCTPLADNSLWTVLHSRHPTMQQDLWSLPLGGNRGRPLSSNKNMQLLETNGEVALQVAKWKEGVFYVDFIPEVPHLVAFSFTVAQLDL